MDATEQATELHQLIETGTVRQVQGLLQDVTSRRWIRNIEDKYTGQTDPVNHAIDLQQEDIACYLVEKGFSVNTLHQKEEERCTSQCYILHGPSQCPSLYDALDNSVCRQLIRLKGLLTEVKEGRRVQGESLHNLRPYEPVTPLPSRHQDCDTLRTETQDESNSSADQARALVQNMGVTFMPRKNKNTLLHSAVRKSPAIVYVFANSGVPVNVQNENGDTALHLAVRSRRLNIVEALLRCGADMAVKNKLGETPEDEATNEIAALIKVFQPGLAAAITRGSVKSVTRLVHVLWCGIHTVIKDNKTAMELASSLSEDDPKVGVCLGVLHDLSRTSELTHAVLSEDVDSLRDILASDAACGINSRYIELTHAVLSEDVDSVRAILASDVTCGINSRYIDRYGTSLLSHALSTNSYQLTQLLIDAGAHVDGVRVRTHYKSAHTTPLMHIALRPDAPIQSAMLLHSRQSPKEHHEKDGEGNTALLAAVSRDLPIPWIKWLLAVHDGYNITDRNKYGMTPRELAKERGSTDIVDCIDDYICSRVGKLFLYHLPVCFYGEDNLNIMDQNGRPLVDLVADSASPEDSKVLQFYQDIERRGERMFAAAATGDVSVVRILNNAHYRDRNGLTALTIAIAHDQIEVADLLSTQSPTLKVLPDNCNRYPLHYAYSLPEDIGAKFVSLLLAKGSRDIEKRYDMNGREPVEYRNLRHTDEVVKMLDVARSLTAIHPEKSTASESP